ncbi:hypothetical protein PoB_007518500 [Plakobranchus ocellatus]|uniref:Uncharacterized protein n=1 Tax=Plakobranchus ocellatus TaxID=259542 RepID=A0AAV4DXE1_9GAST|nr:hypothetical protein PoB_007518500 [Plakobranchus ocellatus]
MRGYVMVAPFPLSNRATDVRPGCKTQRIAPTLRQDGSGSRLGVLSLKELEFFQTCIVGHLNCCLQYGLGLTLHLSQFATRYSFHHLNARMMQGDQTDFNSQNRKHRV